MSARNLARHGRVHQRFDSISNTLSGFPELIDGPVGGMIFREITAACPVDQAVGERSRKHQFTLRHGDETIPHALEPEFRTARFTDPAVEMMRILYMARCAGG